MNLTITHRHRGIPAIALALTLAAMTLGVTAASAATGTPSAPRDVAAKSAGANTPDVSVSWTAPAVRGTSAISAYDLQSSTGSTFTGATTVTLKATSTQATIALPTEATYYLRMAAVNKAGIGTYSSPIEVIYEVVSTSGGGTNYTCTTGTLNGTNCVTTTTTPAIQEPTYSCPAGKQLTGGDCFVVTQYTATATPVYQEECPSGWTGDASSECFRFTTVSETSCTNNGGTWVGGSSANCEFFTPEVKVQTGTTYSCNGSDVLSGTTCTNIVSSPATQGPPYTYGCVSPAVLSGQTCTTTTTTPATKGTSPVVNVYGYVESPSSVTTTTTTTPGTTTTTTLPGSTLHLTAVVVPFALNSARLSTHTERAILALDRAVNKLPHGDTVVSVTVRGYADPIKSGEFNHALALDRARVVSAAFASRLAPNSAYLYKLNVLAGGTKFAASAKEHGTASHRKTVITVDYTN